MAGATGGHPVVLCRGICKTFQEGKLSVEVLKGVDFEVARREQVAVVGASGSGKSTLLHILGGLDAPSSGDLLIDNNDVSKMTQKARGTLRNHVLGFVYQFHHLLPEFTALENVAMPLLIRKDDDKRAVEDAEEILLRVGLQDRMAHKPAELSGGERQRAAIARAMVTRPRCIMADEPTGNLDSKTADAIHELLVELNQENGTALVVVTHDMNLAGKMDRVVRIENGHLTDSSD